MPPSFPWPLGDELADDGAGDADHGAERDPHGSHVVTVPGGSGMDVRCQPPPHRSHW